ncbi:MAG: macrolide family glycosyltransferase [Dysosmobacter sp.]|nr:macrolide family glycosyltransferase [Dysosmobacter sp.]
MNRIVFFSIPAWGHTNPTVEVVRQLTAMGHQVRYYSFAPFKEKLEAAGAEVICCDGAIPPAPRNLDKKLGRDFAALVEMAADTTLALEEQVCRELADFQPDVIVSDSVCFWGKLFAGKLGIPYVCSTTTFAFNQYSARLMKPRAGELLRSLLGLPRISRKMALLRQHGYPVEKVTDLLQNDNETNTIVYTSRAFQPMAETFSDRYAFVGPSVPERNEPLPRKTRPLVYVSLGTVMHDRKSFCRNCVAALKDMDVDAVLSVGTAENLAALGPLPPNMQAAERVDQLSVLRRADVFLTHCGMNSANEAIWYGVPTVLDPQQSEEAAVADRMEELGMGLRLPSEKPRDIEEALQTVLSDDSFRQQTNRIAQSFRTAGGAPKAAEWILSCCKK